MVRGVVVVNVAGEAYVTVCKDISVRMQICRQNAWLFQSRIVTIILYNNFVGAEVER